MESKPKWGIKFKNNDNEHVYMSLSEIFKERNRYQKAEEDLYMAYIKNKKWKYKK